MNTERWARAGLRLVSPIAALLLLPSLIKGSPPEPHAAFYLLGALVAAAAWLARRAQGCWRRSDALWAAAALWMALTGAAWRIEQVSAEEPGRARERVEGAAGAASRRFAAELRRLDGLMEAAGRRGRAGARVPAAGRWEQAVADMRLSDTDGMALYHPEGRLLAWGGDSAAAPADLVQDAPADRMAYGVLMEGDVPHLFAARRVASERVLVAERDLDPSTFIRPHPLTGLEPAVKVEFQLRDAERQAYNNLFSSYRPFSRDSQGTRRPVLFPLRAPDGTLVAVLQVRDLPARERQAAATGLWQDITLLGLALMLLAALRRALIGFPFFTDGGTLARASALIWILRWLLSRARFPHVALLQPLFDFRGYASPLLGAWSQSPGDIFLTAVAALLQAVLLYAAAGRFRQGPAHRGRRAQGWAAVVLGLCCGAAGAAALLRGGAPPAAAWVGVCLGGGVAALGLEALTLGAAASAAGWAGLGLGSAAALTALAILVRSVARDAGPLLLTAEWDDCAPAVVLLQSSLLAASAALALAVLTLGRLSSIPRPAWLEPRWLPGLRPDRRLIAAGLVGVAGVTLAYFPLLFLGAEATRRDLIRKVVLPEIGAQDGRRLEVLNEAVQKAVRDRDLPDLLRHGAPESAPSTAYRLWSQTELGALGYESSLRLEDAQGRVLSRFGLNLPEAFEKELQGNILAEGPISTRVHLLSMEKPVLFARRTIGEPGAPAGAVEIVVSKDYDNIPFVFSSNPYTLLFRSPAVVLERPSLLGAHPVFMVYDADSLAPLFSTDPAAPPPLAASLAERLARETGPFWKSVQRERQSLNLLYVLRDDEIFALGYQREGAVRLAAGWLKAAIRNVVFAGLLALLLCLLIAPAALLQALRQLRPAAQGRTFYRRLFMTLLLASLIPLLALALFLEGILSQEMRRDVERTGSAALAVAQRVVADRIATLPSGSRVVNDDLLYWLSQAIRQDIHIYRGSDLEATSRRELFSSGLLPTRLRGEVYRDLVQARRPTSLRQEVLRGQRFYVISARLDLPAPLGGDWILSLPLGLKQEEIEGKLRDVREATLLTTALLFLLLSLLSYGAAARIARPIRDLADAAGRLAGGDLQVRVERRAEAEFQSLIDVFNHMAAAIRAQQEDLRARRDYIEKILLNATTGVVSFDAAVRVVTVNPAARLLTGAPLDAGTELGAALRGAGLARLAALLPAPPVSDFAERREEAALARDGDERRLRAVLVPLRDQEQTAGGLLLIEDITENVRSDRLRAWAEMAQRIAHEIKNPLTPIQLSAEHLRHVFRDRPPDFERVLDDCLRTITGQVRELRTLAREFSTFARIPELKLERVDLRDVVDGALTPYRSAAPADLRIESRWQDRPIAVRVDQNLMRRALVNLLENSIEALEGHGTIRVDLAELSDDGRRQARIAVEDDGPGIDPAILPRLFEPFFSTKGSGTGLGLAIARQAVEANGGTIAVDRPASGRGTRMTILIPTAEA